MKRISSRWILGLIGAFCVVWGASALLQNTIVPIVFDDAVQRYVKAPGTVFSSRKEGWASSAVGKHGILGIPDITAIQGDKIAIWGDSFVEAVQVKDEDKTAQVLTQLLKNSDLDLTAFSIGSGGLSVADYYFAIPDYERVVSGIAAHVIVLGSIADVLPDMDTLCHSRFLSSPPWLVEAECTPSSLALEYTPWLYRLSLAFMHTLYDKATASPMRFIPQTASRPLPAIAMPPTFSIDDSTLTAWDLLLVSYRRQTDRPVIFLYIPKLPVLVNGRFSLADPNRAVVEQFAATCRQHGFVFVDASPKLREHFKLTGRLSRGFFNMPPGEGHFNRDGHRLAAHALLDQFKRGDHAIQ